MLAFPRRRYEIFAAAAILAAIFGAVLSRVDGVADDTNQQALRTAGAHFSAGVALLQAESRATGRAGLNAQGYPAAADGDVSTDGECLDIWHRVMSDDATAVLARAVDADDGTGKRCEYTLDVATAPSGRVVYWPSGTDTSSATIAGRRVAVTPGEHIHVDLGGQGDLGG